MLEVLLKKTEEVKEMMKAYYNSDKIKNDLFNSNYKQLLIELK